MFIKTLIDETELLKKVAMGDERAFRMLYEQYYRKVFSQATRLMRSEEMGEEIMQEVFLKFWRLGPKLNTIANVDAYLKVSTRNQSLNSLRKLAIENKHSQTHLLNYTEEHNETEESILLNDTRKILTDAIQSLSKQQKEVYILCHQQGLKYDQVAEKLNLSPLTVKTHMQRALKQLRVYLQDHGEIAVLLIIFKII